MGFVHVEFSELYEVSDELAGVMVFDDDIRSESIVISNTSSITEVYADSDGVARLTNFSDEAVFFWVIPRGDLEQQDDDDNTIIVFNEVDYRNNKRILRANQDILVRADEDSKIVIRKV